MIQAKLNYKNIVITKDDFNQRVDNFLFKTLKFVPKSLIYKFLRVGKIRLNAEKVKPSYKLQNKDIINLHTSFINVKNKSCYTKIKNLQLITYFKRRILYEDKTIIVINKPSGIAVHGGTSIKLSIIDVLKMLVGENRFVELAHRLDMETSGVLLATKTRSALKVLHTQLRNRTIKKHYIALVKGIWPINTKKIIVPLKKNVLINGERIALVDNTGKACKTLFFRHKIYKNATLLNVFPITGRMHQIRAHTSYVGHPIACDNRYGDAKFNKYVRHKGLNRLFLHANSITFIHPVRNHKVTIYAPIDNILKKFLYLLEK